MEGGFWQLLIEGQCFILYEMVVEEQSGVGLHYGLKRKLLRLNDSDIILENFGQGSVDLLLLLEREQSLLDVALENVDKSASEFLVEIFDRLDVDQRGSDDPRYF